MNSTINTTNISITKVKESRVGELDLSTLKFGQVMTDHLFIANYRNGNWENPRIIPYEDLQLSPATSGLHYGQSLFEGMKAFPLGDDKIGIFRIYDHHKRMNIGAERLAMPHVPEELFVGGIKTLLDLDRNWMPKKEGFAMYIRPLLFATDTYIGMKTSDTYIFMVFLCPSPPYYSENVRSKVITDYVRSWPGGVGYVKAAGNYAPTLYVTNELKRENFHVGLWLDGPERKYIEEFSTMNAFFVINDTVITPPAPIGGTILNGITRRSVIQILKDNGYKVEERKISIDEIIESFNNNTLQEAFGTGTAAAIAPVQLIQYKDTSITLPDESNWKIVPFLKQQLEGIRYGKIEDKYNWLEII